MQAYDMLRNSNGQGFTSNDGSKVIKSVDDLKQLAKELGGCDDEALKFLDTCEKIPETIKEGETASEAFARTYGSGIKNLGSSIAKLGKTILSSLGKAALSAGITWLATTGIELVAKGVGWLWDEVLTDNAERERRTQAVTSTSENIKTYQQNTEVVDDAIKKYEELNKKINETNITFEEEVGYRKELNELQKSLNEKFGTAAEGLDLVNKGYEGQIKALKELRKEQARTFLYDSKTGALISKDGSTDFQRNLDLINQKVEHAVASLNTGASDTLNEYTGVDIQSIIDKYPQLRQAIIGGGAELTKFQFSLDPNLTQKEADEILTRLYEELDKQFPDNPAVQEFKKTLQESLNPGYDSSQYYTAVENSKQTIRNILAYNSDDGEDILTKLENATNAYNTALARYEKDNTAKNKEELDEAKKNLDEISNTAETILTDSNSYEHRLISSRTGGLDVYGQMINEIQDKKSGGVNGRILGMFDGRLEMFGKLRSELDKMTDEEKLALEVELDGNSEVVTLDNLDKFINQAKKNAAKNPIDLEVGIKASDAVDSMADMKTAVASLGDLYGQVVKLPADATDDAKSAFGFADPATLNSIESAFSKFSKELEDSGNKTGATQINEALENLETTMLKYPGETKKAEDAIDELIGAYLDQTSALKNLNKENKAWSIAQLEAMGVTNAKQVVESRLAKTNKQLSKSYSILEESIKNYKDAVSRNDEETQTKELDKMATALKDLYSNNESSGIINADFVKNNLDLIQAALDDTSGKFNDLDRLLSHEYVTKIRTETNDDELRVMLSDLDLAIQNFDGSSIDIGTSMDGGPIFATLEAIRKSTKMTLEEFQRLVSEASGGTIEAKATYELKDTNVEVPDLTAIMHGNASNLNGVKKMKLKTRIPKWTYEYTGKGRGVTPTYKPSSSSSTGSGGGGGGSSSGSDNKLQEDTKETFDWIEVKIKRLEEAVSRLDEIAGSTYNNWTKRNKALRDEIGKLTEEIEAQEHAQKRYLENANSLKNSNVNIKPTEEESGSKKQYQYDLGKYNAAEKEWNSGKYQKLIREGKLGKDDIERIQNKYLVELINQYTELYQKSVDAGVAANTLRETRKSKYAEQFNNIKAEFEGIISLFEDASTIIDKQIERTEEHGYFVASNYYKKQKELTEKVLADQRSEYAKLVKARDEAVEQGKIDKYSEEWYTMTNDINAVEAAINDSATALVKFDNQLRQLKWDAFDYALGRLDMITTEAEFLNDLLNSQPLFEEDGNFTDRGQTSATLIGIQFDTAMKKAQEYGKAIKEVQADLAKDPNNKNYLEQQEELIKAQQDEIKNAKSLKEAYKDLASEGINKNLEFLQKLIDKYKESLSDAKDLASYQKTINEQTKNISSLERQLAAYAGDDSEEARATIQKLTQSLEDARNNLQETEWDKYISETNDMLDDMYEDYSELLNKRLDNIDELFTWGINDNNKNSENLQTTLNDVATQYGYDITSNFDKIIGSGGTTISDFNQTFTDASASTLTVLGNIYNTILEMAKGTAVQDKVINEGNTGTEGSTDIGGATGKIAANTSKVEATKKKAGWKKDSIGWWYQNADGTYPEKKWEKIGDKWYYFNDEGYMVSNAYQDGYWLTGSGAWDGQKKAGWKKDKKGWWYQYANGSYPKKRFLQIDGKMYYFDEKGYMVTGEKTIQGQKYVFGSDGAAIDQQDFTKVKKGYATGSSGIRSSQMAWTQENGSEIIYRATDGAILTPLSRGDMVFTNDMSKALWNLAKNPSLARSSITLPSVNGTARTINNENEITLVLPNVTNYEEFKSALTKDPKFVNFVQATTIGQALGKGRLNRGNF